MLKKSDIYRLVNDYIGVSKGYLHGFSYKTHYEFYRYYCDLEINVADYEPGTTREKFIRILEEASPLVQAKILKGVFQKYPILYFEEKEREIKQLIYDEYQGIIARLEISVQGVSSEVKNLNLNTADWANAWTYAEAHPEEIEAAIRENEET